MHAESAEPLAPPPDDVAAIFADGVAHVDDEWALGELREPHTGEPLAPILAPVAFAAPSPAVPLLRAQQLAPQPANAASKPPAPRTDPQPVAASEPPDPPMLPVVAEPEGQPAAVVSDDSAILLPAHMPTFVAEQDAAHGVIEDAWPEGGEGDEPPSTERANEGPPPALVGELRTKLAQIPGFGAYADQLADLAPELPEDALQVMLGLLGPDPLSALSALQPRTGT